MDSWYDIQSQVNRKGHVQGKTQVNKSQVNVRKTVRDTRHLQIEGEWGKRKLNESMAAGEACKATF